MAGNNALAKLYSWADGVKRRARNPMQTLALGLTQANEDLQQAATDADIAYGRNGMKSVLLSQQQRDEAAKRAAQFGEQMAMAAATVYHGSPHKFDKFDSSKIGTGEGKQQQGIGSYFAESPAVAQKYADKESWKRGMDGGFVYKVDVPDNLLASMANHDAPLSQQPEQVRKAIERIFDADAKKALKDYHGWDNKMDAPFAAIMDALEIAKGNNRAATSEALRSAGVPGIRYLDGGSRGAGAGTSNYVVFPGNENLLRILERNGMAP